ncbi:TIGR02611 family protein [Aquipuribacter sp. SD81]|uniref:TIGR02611 family protein n=1 Tax=Aquipuribacter sp. SD81 TaxID=3127703 RepID=UPI003015A385
MGPPTGPGARTAARADDGAVGRGPGPGPDDVPAHDRRHGYALPGQALHPRVARARRRFRRLSARVRLVRRRVRRTPAGRIGWRLGVGLVGGVLLVAGVVMIPGPGQGWATVFLALAILSTEFGWAQRVRHGLWVRLVEARRHYAANSPRRRAVLGTAVALVTLVALALALWVGLLVTGAPSWLPGPVRDVLDRVPGVG